MKYKDYLKTSHWFRTKKKHYENPENGVCSACGSDENLEVHHKRYHTGRSLLFREKPNILSTLCRECHQERTDQIKHQKKIEADRNLLKKIGTIAYFNRR